MHFRGVGAPGVGGLVVVVCPGAERGGAAQSGAGGSGVCREQSCVRALRPPPGTGAAKALQNTSRFGCNILARENCAFQLKVKILKSKLMLFAKKSRG